MPTRRLMTWIGTETFPVTGTQFDMSDAVNWITANDYTLSVQANGAVDSLWSDEYDVRYFALYSQLTYGENAVSWRYVVGATAYEVVVNRGTEYAGETIVVEDGSNRAEVKLTKAGENTISVRFIRYCSCLVFVRTSPQGPDFF